MTLVSSLDNGFDSEVADPETRPASAELIAVCCFRNAYIKDITVGSGRGQGDVMTVRRLMLALPSTSGVDEMCWSSDDETNMNKLKMLKMMPFEQKPFRP